MRRLRVVLLASLWLPVSCFQPQPAVSNLEKTAPHARDNADQGEKLVPVHSAHVYPSVSRRLLFQGATSVSCTVLASRVDSRANAAGPVTAIQTDGFTAKVQRLLRPKPPKALRPKLQRDFAVLLMRSSYNALDRLDCVAMDQFQRDFFLIRQAEYEFYVNQVGPGIVQQGDLADPYYFDFISFAQYATINRDVFQDPAVIFNERKPVEGAEGEPQQFTSVLTRRDPSLTNDMLAPTHRLLVGSAILDKLEESFGDTDARIPPFEPKSRPNADLVLASVTQLVKLFLLNGYAWDGTAFVSNAASKGVDASGAQFSISLTAPANIWSGKALQLRNMMIAGGGIGNSFPLTTAQELVRRMGYEVSSSSVTYDGSKEISTFTLR